MLRESSTHYEMKNLSKKKGNNLKQSSGRIGDFEGTITPLTQKRVKNPKKSAIIDHILLEGHNATYDDFSILTTESNEFKLHLKESLLIKRDKRELNRNCYTHHLDLFD